MLAEPVREWTLDWKQQGLDEREKRGMQKGEATLLRLQLAHRFGPLPAWAEERLAAALSEQLERWAARVLDATSLEAVVGNAPAEDGPPAH